MHLSIIMLLIIITPRIEAKQSLLTPEGDSLVHRNIRKLPIVSAKTDPYYAICSPDEPKCEKSRVFPESSRVLSEHRRVSFVKRFMAYFEKFQKDLTKLSSNQISRLDRSFCSGSLISSQHVLTAGHCICVKIGECQDTASGMKTRYDVSKYLMLWLGLSSDSLICGEPKNLSILHYSSSINVIEARYKKFDNIKDSRYIVAKAILHPDYRHGRRFDLHDIAILKLKTPVCKGPTIAPIALPTKDITERIGDGSRGLGHIDYGRTGKMDVTWVYNGGYGVTNRQAGECKTSRNGPSPFHNCKFPFRIKLPQSHDMACKIRNRIFDRCVNVFDVMPPAFYQRDCLLFERAWKRLHNQTLTGLIHAANPWLAPQNYQILDELGGCTTQCYTSSLLLDAGFISYARHGWCATCDPDARSGEPNFCGSHGNSSAVAVAEPAANWGFCQWNCSATRETTVIRPNYEDGNNMYLADSFCKKRLGSFIDLENEFCASFVNVQEQLRYKLYNNGSIEQVAYRKDNVNLRFTGAASKSRYICEGDSGGPLWINWPDSSAPENKAFFNKTSDILNRVEYIKRRHDFDIKGATKPYLLGVIRRSDGCGHHNKPAVYGRVSFYLDWIKSVIKDAKKSTKNCLVQDAQSLPEEDVPVPEEEIRENLDLFTEEKEIDLRINIELELLSGDKP